MRKVIKIQPETAKPKLRTAAYCRVSTQSAEQILSLEAQKRHYEKIIKDNTEWEFAGLYCDEGISGTKKENRQGLIDLICDCQKRKIDFIITKSISRFARNTADCLELVRKLSELGVHIYFEKENIDTRSMDTELMLTILGSLAENESVAISENTKWSVQKRFKNGTYRLSSLPYGYYYVNGDIMIKKEEAEVVKRIYAGALAGKGIEKIAQELNKEGIMPKKGLKWSRSSVRDILHNENYTGDLILQKTYTDNFKKRRNKGEKDKYLIKNHHEAIISHDEFEAANLALRKRGQEKGISEDRAKYTNRYIFSGKIKCSECKSSFKRRIHGTGANKYTAWCCAKHLKKECHMLFIREKSIQEAFIVMLNKLIFAREHILDPLIGTLSQGTGICRLEETDKKIQQNKDRIHTLISLMSKGYLEPSVYNEEYRKLKIEGEKLKEEKVLACLNSKSGTVELSELLLLRGFTLKSSGVQSFDNSLFEKFIHSITVFSPSEIGFNLKCGLVLKERIER